MGADERNDETAGGGDYDIFISYAQPDRSWVLSLAEQLAGLRLQVLLEDFENGPGEPFIERMRQRLEHCRYLVFVISKDTPDYQLPERTLEFLLDSYYVPERFIPIIIDSIDWNSLPPLLLRLRPLDVSDRDIEFAAQKLFELIHAPDDTAPTPAQYNSAWRRIPETDQSNTANSQALEVNLTSGRDGATRALRSGPTNVLLPDALLFQISARLSRPLRTKTLRRQEMHSSSDLPLKPRATLARLASSNKLDSTEVHPTDHAMLSNNEQTLEPPVTHAGAPPPPPAQATPSSQSHSSKFWIKVGLWGAAALGLLYFGADAIGIKILAIFGSTSDDNPLHDAEPTNPVDCSVFAPPDAPIETPILVQVFLHPPELEDDAERRALAADDSSRWRGFTSLSLDLPSGATVGFELRIPGFEIGDDGMGQIRWNNRISGQQFEVKAPAGCSLGVKNAKLIISSDGIPVGRILFRIEVTSELAQPGEAEPRGHTAKRYSRAFVSYSSTDRSEVIKRTQALQLARVSVFQDILSLDAGGDWEKTVYEKIDSCDLFLLCWSSSSRASKRVREEYLYAIDRQEDDPNGDPDIVPMIIERPPPLPPPKELEHLHFNDRHLFFMED